MTLDINLWALLIGVLSTFLVGGLWYSKGVFGGIWQREVGDRRPANSNHPLRVFLLSSVFALVAILTLRWCLGAHPRLPVAVAKGAIAGSGLVAMGFGINHQFADRSLKLWLIDGGYFSVQFAVYGLVLGLWG
ncbi:MAG TPA: DUF1761 domain-containing protein [Fibrobacteres bacterium]|jgi:hypothetical protein|nr:DUF1761 domain-containing protein [Fibrobacterota bacterium]